MKNILFYFLIVNFFNLPVIAQPGLYSSKTIPEAIKGKASVIVNLENIELNVENSEKATLNVHKIFTVLNEDGKAALIFNEFSSKNISSLEEAEIKVYDSNGKLTEKHKKKEMMTHSVGEGLIEDGFVTYYKITNAPYPITVEFNYEKKIKSTLFIPDYRFINFGEAIIESNYSARVPAEIGLKYKAFNTSIQPVISEDGGYKIYKWIVRDMAPIEYEEGAVSSYNKYPHIAIAADNFSYYGFRGDLSTWKSFGLWINQLYKDLDILSADRQQFFVQLVKDALTKEEKIKRIYKYLQANFRYVSIQLGVGGLKPFSAEFTDQKKYGDCKALSNYMKAALKAVGMKSHIAIINSDYNKLPVDPDFPSNNFNHVILCIPGSKDSIWLECTSSTAEFGQLGTFTENKNALLITDDGGILVPTPKSHSIENVFSTFTTVTLLDDLSAQTQSNFTSSGEYREMMSEMLKEKKDDQKEEIVSFLGFKQPDNFELLNEQATNGYITKLNMDLRTLPEFNAGSKSFISRRIYKLWPYQLPKSENRKFDFYFRYPFEKYDTTIFKLPPSLKPDVLLKEKEIKCAYATYKSKSWYNETENSVYSTASLTLNQHKILASDYPSVKKFFDELMQDDAQKIILRKVEN